MHATLVANYIQAYRLAPLFALRSRLHTVARVLGVGWAAGKYGASKSVPSRAKAASTLVLSGAPRVRLGFGLTMIVGCVALLWAAIPKNGEQSWLIQRWWSGGETFLPLVVVSGLAIGLTLALASLL